MTAKDLINFCVRNAVTITIEPDPCGMEHIAYIKVSDWSTNKHFAITVDLYELDRTDADIVDWIINEASFKLGLDNRDERIRKREMLEFEKARLRV